MLDALRFVAAAIARKDYVSDLTHFLIKDGRVTGYNGVIALSSDIDIDLNIRPSAAPLLAAVKGSTGVISLNMTPGGRLAVRSDKFKTFIDCLPDDFASNFVAPDGETVTIGPEFLQGLRELAPLMGIDASRPWAMGIRVAKQSMFATNNSMLGEFWHGVEMPLDVIIPAMAVDQLLRINEPPTKVQLTDHSISFWFGEKRWLRSSLVDPQGWPDASVSTILANANTARPQPVPSELADALQRIKPFLGEASTVYVEPDKISTSPNEQEGASVEIVMGDGIGKQAYALKQLEILSQVATTVDWDNWPKPVAFRSERLRGVMVGQRL